MKYPIGQQDFPSIREEGKVYVDKTRIIYELVNNSKYVFLARPRRFGKSLLLSTIKAFFEGRKDLFHGLAIEALEKDWVRHPVFLLELSRVNPSSHDSLKELLNQQFSLWEEELGIVNSNNDFGSRFATILIKSYDKHRQKAVVLVDEYDNPLINTLGDDRSLVHDQNRELLKSVYSNLKALDSHIRFGMLTGVSRFSKMSIFSGLNNLNDISFNRKYDSICGITKAEILKFLDPGVDHLSLALQISKEETYRELAKWYDGYHFSESCPDIYNPFSLLTALANEKISDYWLETATPEFLIQKLKETTSSLSEIFNDTVDEADLAASDTSFSSPVALLYQTGYLTIKSYDKKSETYKVGIPNREVRRGFLPALLGQFIGKDKGKAKREAILIKEALIKGDIETFMAQLDIFLATVPYNVMPKLSEKYFQNSLYLLFAVMGLEIEAEKPNSFGRSDLIVKTDKYIYIFELKLDGSPDQAIRQIEEKGYAKPYLNDGRQIIMVGINFSSATRNLSSWLIK